MQVYLLNPLENLRSYINNRPPLVIFMFSVSAVAIAFLTIGYFFKIKEIKSAEFTEVKTASGILFCIREVETPMKFYGFALKKCQSLMLCRILVAFFWTSLINCSVKIYDD